MRNLAMEHSILLMPQQGRLIGPIALQLLEGSQYQVVLSMPQTIAVIVQFRHLTQQLELYYGQQLLTGGTVGVTVVNGTVYAGNGNNVSAYDASTGNSLWTTAVNNG